MGDKQPYLVLDMETGLMDGWYVGHRTALNAAETLRHALPGHRWVVLQAVTDARRPRVEGYGEIKDGVFWFFNAKVMEEIEARAEKAMEETRAQAQKALEEIRGG